MVSLRSLSTMGLILAALLAPKFVWAEDVLAGSVYDADKENETVQAARKHAYVGGRDESDLVVQPQLQAPTRKIIPQVEAASEPAGDDAF